MISEKQYKYKKITLECSVCKTKFELWISIGNYSPAIEKLLKENFHLFCPVCRALKELERKEQK